MTSRLRALLRFHRLWVAAVALQASALALASAARSLPLLAGAAAVYMAALMTLMICQASLRQELTPEDLLGRVTSAYLVAIALPTPLGALAATTLAAHFGADAESPSRSFRAAHPLMRSWSVLRSIGERTAQAGWTHVGPHLSDVGQAFCLGAALADLDPAWGNGGFRQPDRILIFCVFDDRVDATLFGLRHESSVLSNVQPDKAKPPSGD
jgi:hypothetical protein